MKTSVIHFKTISLSQWFSNLTKYHTHSEGLLKHKQLDPILRVSDSAGLSYGPSRCRSRDHEYYCLKPLKKKKIRNYFRNWCIVCYSGHPNTKKRGLKSYTFWGRNHPTDLQLQQHCVCVCVLQGAGWGAVGELQVCIIFKFLHVHFEESWEFHLKCGMETRKNEKHKYYTWNHSRYQKILVFCRYSVCS